MSLIVSRLPAHSRNWCRALGYVALASTLLASTVRAESGYELWLRYERLPEPQRELALDQFRVIVVDIGVSPTIDAAVAELQRGFETMLGRELPVVACRDGEPLQPDGAVSLCATVEAVAAFDAVREATGFDGDGYIVASAESGERRHTLIYGPRPVARLYGTFALLRHLATGGDPRAIDLQSAPQIEHRLLNHWDNLDRSVERGYAGLSLWDWMTLPEHRSERYVDYARANASICINGTVLNNVNARADSLTADYIAKAAALAEVFRPYGIRVYLSARFSAPREIGGLDTADPLDPAVRAWWRAKADEIYAAIPDFGGFLVKANSEGQPGPQDYGRTHADGANLLAEAVAPHGGIVMWRAFVYSDTNPEDRAKQAYSEFLPLDGDFADNVIVQVKNGPIDFQPREPFHPLFGAMRETPLMVELQITKEYLGMASHLAWLGPLYEEALQADTFAEGPGSTVARVADGSLYGHSLSAIAGVANTGTDLDWTGSIFNQANWYAFGRLAWDPDLTADAIADEWLRQTFSPAENFVEAATELMNISREAVVDYMTPLGLTHLMATGHHYGPGPWVSDLNRPEWNPVYYHRADAGGIGFDRTATGSDAISQYAPEVAERFADPESTGEEFLLWFHHLPWDYELASGETLWETLVRRYDRGVAEVEDMQRRWAALESFVDEERFTKTAELLAVQLREARWWRDACIAYFQSISGLPLPAGVAPPERSLDDYIAIDNRDAPG